jgi:hypothetical protein
LCETLLRGIISRCAPPSLPTPTTRSSSPVEGSRAPLPEGLLPQAAVIVEGGYTVRSDAPPKGGNVWGPGVAGHRAVFDSTVLSRPPSSDHPTHGLSVAVAVSLGELRGSVKGPVKSPRDTVSSLNGTSSSPSAFISHASRYLPTPTTRSSSPVKGFNTPLPEGLLPQAAVIVQEKRAGIGVGSRIFPSPQPGSSAPLPEGLLPQAAIIVAFEGPVKSPRDTVSSLNGTSSTPSTLISHASRYSLLYLGTPIAGDAAIRLLTDAFEMEDKKFGEQAANEWGRRNFPDRDSALARAAAVDDAALLAASGDFRSLAQSRLNDIQPNRLSPSRAFATLSPDNPDLSNVLDVAAGVHVPLQPNFIPNGASASTRPPLRAKYLRTHLAVDKAMYDLVEAGLAFCFTMPVAERIPDIHFSPAHWAVKANKEQGRPIIDCTDAHAVGSRLNGEDVKSQADERWGNIKLPTIVDVILCYLSFRDEHPNAAWYEIEAWKMDLKGAFTLLSYKADNCQYFAMELVGGLVIVFLCCLFGWTATPACFQVISRALMFEIAKRGIFSQFQAQTISIARKNVLRALYAFFSMSGALFCAFCPFAAMNLLARSVLFSLGLSNGLSNSTLP